MFLNSRLIRDILLYYTKDQVVKDIRITYGTSERRALHLLRLYGISFPERLPEDKAPEIPQSRKEELQELSLTD